VDQGVTTLDAWGLAQAIRDGETSASEAVEASLAELARLDPLLNVSTVAFEEEARAAARAADRSTGTPAAGPLHGVPVLIKDQIWMRGAPATLASRSLEDFVPDEDAVVVSRLRAAGAIVVAKTTNPEFLSLGYTNSELQGVSRNPWDPSRTPGGSSGGSAAGVAAGIAPIAIGSDAGGSIRIPASFCGVVGLKPTHGLVPRTPGFDGWRTIEAQGPLTRSVRDAALTLGVLAGPDPSDDLSLPGLGIDYVGRLGSFDPSRPLAWSVDLGYMQVEEEVRSAFLATIATLRELGWNLEEVDPGLPDPEPMAIAMYVGEVGRPPAGREHLLGPVTRALFDDAAATSVQSYYEMRRERARYARAWEDLLHRYDLMLTPTVSVLPFAAEGAEPFLVDGRPTDPDYDYWFGQSVPANMTGQPSVTVPMPSSSEGLPLGLQLTARRCGDDVCLAAAASYERALPWPTVAPIAASGP
jgi:Asp-tRNA(Asn)/Glu-tRNA(Gln) amidotransferase A subunit family amidase